MICEKCQVNEATVHNTHSFPLQPDEREPNTVVRQHLCEDCASAFQLAYQQFMYEQPQHLRQGMSKQERWEVNQHLREALQQYLREWTGSENST